MKNVSHVLRSVYLTKSTLGFSRAPSALNQCIEKDLLAEMWATMLPHGGAGIIFRAQQDVTREMILSIIGGKP